MINLLFGASIVANLVELVKEAHEKPIPAENWANKEAIRKDRMSGMSEKQILKNVENGKYYSDVKYPEPHRDPVSGKIIIENYKLYREDVKKYGAVQAQKWVKQGRYNLTSEELEKEKERIKDEVKKEYEDLYNLLR